MALIAANSFQYHVTGWTFGNVSQVAGEGQSGLAALKESIGQNGSAVYAFAGGSEWIVGFCYRLTTLADALICQFRQTGGAGFEVYHSADGAIYAKRPGQAEVGRSVNGLVRQSTDIYIEMRIKASTTVGEIEVRVNGNPTPVLNVTGINTGAATYNEWAWAPNAVLRPSWLSAFYLLDKSGPAPQNNFLGHIRYAVLEPIANGNSSQLTGSDGNQADNYAMVDDLVSGGITTDGDTTYVQSAIVGEKDTYGLEDMPTPPQTIYAVVPVLVAKKADAGTRGVKPLLRRSGTDYQGATEHFLGTSYAAYSTITTQDPSTSAAWTEAGVNALELGVEVTT